MAIIREEHEDHTRNRTNNWRKNFEQSLLKGRRHRIEATYSFLIQKHQNRKHNQCKKGMDKVP